MCWTQWDHKSLANLKVTISGPLETGSKERISYLLAAETAFWAEYSKCIYRKDKIGGATPKICSFGHAVQCLATMVSSLSSAVLKVDIVGDIFAGGFLV